MPKGVPEDPRVLVVRGDITEAVGEKLIDEAVKQSELFVGLCEALGWHGDLSPGLGDERPG